MIIFKKPAALREFLDQKKAKHQIGFVPTMGALHEGHVSLVKQALEGSQVTVTSIFVNPTQFNDKADFAKYPVVPDEDIAMLIEAGCDVLFYPSVDEMYPGGGCQNENLRF